MVVNGLVSADSLCGGPVSMRDGVVRASKETGAMAREYVWLECTETGLRNYRVSKETRGTERLELKKYCKKLRKHTVHKESRKK
jgi:large subunit ribosomal protein L33